MEHTTPPVRKRIDILLGRAFGPVTAYFYGKRDDRGQAHLGTRLDTSIRFWKQRASTTFQFRGFVGLNSASQPHMYWITNLNFRLDKQGLFRPGLLEYGIKRRGSKAVMYIGPALTLRPSAVFRLRLSYGVDILNHSRLLYLKMSVYP